VRAFLIEEKLTRLGREFGHKAGKDGVCMGSSAVPRTAVTFFPQEHKLEYRCRPFCSMKVTLW